MPANERRTVAHRLASLKPLRQSKTNRGPLIIRFFEPFRWSRINSMSLQRLQIFNNVLGIPWNYHLLFLSIKGRYRYMTLPSIAAAHAVTYRLLPNFTLEIASTPIRLKLHLRVCVSIASGIPQTQPITTLRGVVLCVPSPSPLLFLAIKK